MDMRETITTGIGETWSYGRHNQQTSKRSGEWHMGISLKEDNKHKGDTLTLSLPK